MTTSKPPWRSTPLPSLLFSPPVSPFRSTFCSLSHEPDQTAFLSDPPLAAIAPRRRRQRPSRAGGQPVSLMPPGAASTWVAIPRTCPPTLSASPSSSGPEAVSPGTRPSLRSSSEPPTASWSVPEEPATSLSHPRQPLDVTDVGEGPCLSLLPFSAGDTTLYRP